MHRRHFLAFLAAFGPLAATAAAQQQRADAAVAGQIIDSASGTPLLRARVCSYDRPHARLPCAPADTAGRYRLEELFAGPQQLIAYCETGRRTFDERLLDTVPVVLAPAEQRQRDFRVPAAGCDHRPYEIVTGEFTGHWAFGFELDDFVPCGDSTEHAWVERRGLRPGELWHLPEGEFYEGGNRWFVRWRGVWIGPRSLLPAYHMVVDSVIDMRIPQPDDCAT